MFNRLRSWLGVRTELSMRKTPQRGKLYRAFLEFEALEGRFTPNAFMVNSTVDAPDAHPGDGVAMDAQGRRTLRAAIEEANAFPGADTITVAAGDYSVLIALPPITESVSITGGGFTGTIIERSNAAVDNFPIFQITAGTVMIGGVTIMGGTNHGVQNDGGTVTLGGCDIGFNTGTDGGGISNKATMTIQSCHIYGNTATGPFGGGGIWNSLGTLTIQNSTINGNSATEDGGGLLSLGGQVTIGYSAIYDNSASFGGGIYIEWADTQLSMTGGSIFSNSAEFDGGGIYQLSGNSSFAHVSLTNNTAENKGGGLYAKAGVLTLHEPTAFSGNVALVLGPGGARKPDAVVSVVNPPMGSQTVVVDQ